jgi:Phospholipid methyltransferase
MEMLFGFTIATQVLLALSLVWSIVFPNTRVWPPPQRSSWQFWFTWVGTVISIFGCLALGVLGWGAGGLSLVIRLGIGIPLLVGGITFALWGVRTLSAHASLGLGDQLIEKGPYRYTRNPQYVGDIVALGGWVLLADSPALAWAGLGASSWFFLAPFAEEPWLRVLFGDAYIKYCRTVPRFLGLISDRRSAAA